MSDYEMTLARECVARGVAYLDKLMPAWREKIDPDTLDIADPGLCVFGQIYSAKGAVYNMSGWTWWRSFVDPDNDDVAWCGFDIGYFSYPDECFAPRESLNAAWREVLQAS